MSYKVATPEQAYRSDDLYENHLCKAMDYLSSLLQAPRSVNFLKLIGHKPTYVIDYNMGSGSPEGVDDMMADRIVQLFKEGGWYNVYWKELEVDVLNPHHQKWGYTFHFERPVDSVPYDVMVRLAKDAYGTAAGVVDDLGSIRASVTEVCEVFDVVLKMAEGKEYTYTGDTTYLDTNSREFKGIGVYKVSGTAVRFVIVPLAEHGLVYRKPCGTLYRYEPSKPWVPYGTGDIVLNNNLFQNALTQLRSRYEYR